MMKKEWVIVGGITVLAVVGGLTYVIINRDSYKNSSHSYSAKSYAKVDACSYLTQAVANKVLGAGAKKGENPVGDVDSDDLSVSTCTYASANDGSLESIHNLQTATILMRAPKTATGVNSNKAVFASPKSGSVAVSGYGSKAFWDPALGQLNVLSKDNVWFILSVGPTKISDRTQDVSTAFAGTIGLSSNTY